MRHWLGLKWLQRKDGYHVAHAFSVIHTSQTMAISLCHKRKVLKANLISRKAGTEYCKECEKREAMLNE